MPPLTIDFSKADVISLSNDMGLDITNTYSCHQGEANPCGKCISCKEKIGAEKMLKNKTRRI